LKVRFDGTWLVLWVQKQIVVWFEEYIDLTCTP
jgi:hypothetical protein